MQRGHSWRRPPLLMNLTLLPNAALYNTHDAHAHTIESHDEGTPACTSHRFQSTLTSQDSEASHAHGHSSLPCVKQEEDCSSPYAGKESNRGLFCDI